jgi:hypothetical protein
MTREDGRSTLWRRELRQALHHRKARFNLLPSTFSGSPPQPSVFRERPSDEAKPPKIKMIEPTSHIQGTLPQQRGADIH